MDILKVIQERRSIRKYKTDPVPGEILLEILEAARRAPSWANTQTWRFIVVKDQETKRLLSETLTPTNPCRNALLEAPVVICVASKKGLAGFAKGEARTDKGDWFMFDAGIAMEHVALASWSLGLGTCHVGAFDAKKAGEILAIPEDYAMVEIMPVGYFDTVSAQSPRKPIEEIVYQDKFGITYTVK